MSIERIAQQDQKFPYASKLKFLDEEQLKTLADILENPDEFVEEYNLQGGKKKLCNHIKSLLDLTLIKAMKVVDILFPGDVLDQPKKPS
ncbi:uncharacterized protein MONOS_9535 [Monocercomonoides exilis]|uniref:uncharacterized protein n=1 Tax=Monocercomonoides exilis TaxID=2049356 RepID=UPI003559D91E|nr:hypothetical protein MONOS_9535 [Monocercomonoides exilis]|eukprot:MONOS_9535.1-p1 / transcript=MONOS_9535.1 / gene=MONOS_9535 / organism=Monocercomonoides_exilis_PA203 / gene_product=unspecified product / transcript_product=unspecified product / location=Mono_scaffold00397:37645-37973(-) / protein_length=89 / sequence_SO=supercontig / SO=protein_coding / is_pseudo=false